MTARIDHEQEANLAAAAGKYEIAQYHATMLRAEQQRIANVIALAGLAAPNGFENEVYDARLEALMEGLLDTEEVAAVAGYGPAGIDERAFIRPEIKKTLGLA